MSTLVRLAWIATTICAVVAAIMTAQVLTDRTLSAPQQAAQAAAALALVIVPYCMARAFEGLKS